MKLIYQAVLILPFISFTRSQEDDSDEPKPVINS